MVLNWCLFSILRANSDRAFPRRFEEIGGRYEELFFGGRKVLVTDTTYPINIDFLPVEFCQVQRIDTLLDVIRRGQIDVAKPLR